MHNSVSEQSFYIDESEEEDDEEKQFDKGEDDGNDSDTSNYSNDNRQQSKPNSLNTTWPQSYRSLYLSVLFFSIYLSCFALPSYVFCMYSRSINIHKSFSVCKKNHGRIFFLK